MAYDQLRIDIGTINDGEGEALIGTITAAIIEKIRQRDRYSEYYQRLLAKVPQLVMQWDGLRGYIPLVEDFFHNIQPIVESGIDQASTLAFFNRDLNFDRTPLTLLANHPVHGPLHAKLVALQYTNAVGEYIENATVGDVNHMRRLDTWQVINNARQENIDPVTLAGILRLNNHLAEDVSWAADTQAGVCSALATLASLVYLHNGSYFSQPLDSLEDYTDDVVTSYKQLVEA